MGRGCSEQQARHSTPKRFAVWLDESPKRPLPYGRGSLVGVRTWLFSPTTAVLAAVQPKRFAGGWDTGPKRPLPYGRGSLLGVRTWLFSPTTAVLAAVQPKRFAG